MEVASRFEPSELTATFLRGLTACELPDRINRQLPQPTGEGFERRGARSFEIGPREADKRLPIGFLEPVIF